jgi:uncharacterized membrane protein YcaP (DUF421 family)
MNEAAFNSHVLINIMLRSAVIYLIVLAGIRMTGKREVGQMAPFDLVLLLLIANAVQNAMTGPDTSLVGGLVAAGTLFAMNAGVTRLVWRYRRFRGILEGSPTLLVHKGKILSENLMKERITSDDLHQALREHGISDISEVDSAVLEMDGSISVLKKDEIPSLTKPHHRIRFIRKK